MAATPGEAAGGTPAVPLYTYATSPVGAPSGVGTRTAARQARVALQNASAVADGSGTVLSANDSSGFGLNRPYLGWHAYQTAQETTPPASTVSGTFEALWTLSAEPQHPKLRARVRVVNGAATSGEVRLVDRVTGTVLSSILVVGSGATVEADLEGALIAPVLAGAGAPMRVDVQARRTGGANSVAVLLMHALGKGT